ncbi:hypothetical protein NL676_029485 [Syzygium grande]|nr:hypothetical protein NL676_029485 [Syzygium grande]
MDELWVVSQGNARTFPWECPDHKKILESSLNQSEFSSCHHPRVVQWGHKDYLAKHITRLSNGYREKAKKDEETITADYTGCTHKVVKKGCGKSSAPFPQELQENVTLLGNNILEDLQEDASLLALEVLRRYEHPLNEVKPVPRVDNLAKWTSLVLCSGHASWGYLKNVFVKFDTHGTGCFFTSSRGLRSYERPPNEVKPVPRVDSSGQVCGATFKVDAETKQESSMPRVGSAVN